MEDRRDRHDDHVAGVANRGKDSLPTEPGDSARQTSADGGVSRRALLKSVAVSAGAAAFGTGLTSAGDGPRHLQVPTASDLCGATPTIDSLALIEKPRKEYGRGFYAGTATGAWSFAGWLEQTPPDRRVGGNVRPDDDATAVSHRLLHVERPEQLTQYRPDDDTFAFVTDPSHPRGRGFYTGGSNGVWYFVGWLSQTAPSDTASGSVSADGGDSLDARLLQVRTPEQLDRYEPTDNSLAFIEDPSHPRGRGFYAGGSNGVWYFVGWLSQTAPSGTASNMIDPSSAAFGGLGGADEEEEEPAAAAVTDPGTLSDGAWSWTTDEIDAYEPWFGESLQVASIGHGKQAWENFVDFNTRGFPEWVDGGSNRVLLPHIPMLPRSEVEAVGRETALRNLADGAYNDRFRTMARNFEADGFGPGNLVLRIGNEFNIKVAPYSPLGTDVGPETWTEGYRQIVRTCREVLGEGLTTVWSPLIHSAQMPSDTVLAHYPGADYAMVGADIYDAAPAYGREGPAPDGIDYENAGPADRKTVQEYVWTENHRTGNKWGNDGVGLDDIASLSETVDRPIVVPEWGLSHDGGEWGGGVNPTFVRKMYDWMTTHDVAFHAYFEHDTPRVAHSLSGEGEYDFATASSVYRKTFGGKSGTVGEPTDDGGSRTNYIFVTEEELETQKQRAEAGKQPWKRAYNRLLDDADAGLSGGLQSVTDDDGNHRFVGDRNGQHDYFAAVDMSRVARDCALAYRFTGEDRYAERAVEVIHHWCLAEDTYMEPTTNIVGISTTLEQHMTIPAFAYAASLVEGHPAWDGYDGSRPWDGKESPNAEAAFERWVRDRQSTFKSTRPFSDRDGLCEYNNKWAWRIADRAVSASYLNDDQKMDEAKCMWKGNCANCADGKQRPWNDFVNNYRDSRAYDGDANPNDNGLFKHELNRGEAFSYTTFNLRALLMSSLVFERYDGTDLYDYNAPSDRKSGSTLRKALNWFDDYVQDTSAWKWSDGGLVPKYEIEQAASMYETAYAHWGDYKDVLDNPDRIGGRPHYDPILLGHVTLTHGAE
jgi:hypothetical protein